MASCAWRGCGGGWSTTRALFRRTELDETPRWVFGWSAILIAQGLILGWLGRLAWSGSFQAFAWKMAGSTVLAIAGAAMLSSAISRKKASANGLAVTAFTGIVIAWPVANWAGETLFNGEHPGTVSIIAAGLAAAVLAVPIRWIVGDSGAESP